MKKIIALLLAAALTVFFMGCDAGQDKETTNDAKATEQTESVEPTEETSGTSGEILLPRI